MPISAACHRRVGTAAPSSTAGSASSGSAASVASTTIEATPIPIPASDAEIPACTSIWYCSAPAAAAPPGTTRPNAPEASCDVTTGHHERASTASRCSSHMPAQLRTWAAIIAANQYASIVTTCGHASSTLEHGRRDAVEDDGAHQQRRGSA